MSRLEIIETSTPYSFTISFMYISANWSMVYVIRIGNEWVEFKSQSRIIQMASCIFVVFERLITKSIMISSHFHLGI